MRRRLLGRGRRDKGVPYNTIIGGIASKYPTASSLATVIGLTAADISYYNINGSDIEAKINANYNIHSGVFSSTVITRFEEFEPRVTGLNTDAFRYCPNLSVIKILGSFSIIGSYVFAGINSWAIKTIILPEVTGCDNGTFHQLYASNLWIPKLTSLGTSALDNGVFSTARNLFTVHANVALQTNNAGAMDGDLQFLVNRGHIVNFVTEYTP